MRYLHSHTLSLLLASSVYACNALKMRSLGNYYHRYKLQLYIAIYTSISIRESVDSLCRDGMDTTEIRTPLCSALWGRSSHHVTRSLCGRRRNRSSNTFAVCKTMHPYVHTYGQNCNQNH